MGAWESFLTTVHSAAPCCILTALKMSDCNTGTECALRAQTGLSVFVDCVYYPDLYSHWALKSVAFTRMANNSISIQQVNQRSPYVPAHFTAPRPGKQNNTTGGKAI